ncbi:MAG: redoxin domain-containing protein [Candidatus Saccharibacteria bacterium]
MRNLLLVVLMLGLYSCNPTPHYGISVSITSAKGKAYLSSRINGEWVKLDSAKLHKGEAKFRGTVENPDICYLSVGNSTQKLPFFIENSDILILGTLDSLSSAKVSGSATQDEYQKLQSSMDELDKKATDLFNQSKEMEKSGNKAKADSLLAQSDAIFTSIDNQQKDYIKANPASWITPYLLSRVYYDMESDVLDSFLKGLDPKLDSVPTVLTLKERVAKLKTVAIGQTAPDFTMNDVDGNPVKLSDVYSKNKYTLIDFWASWCGPCRHENPNVVATFNNYKAKGFGVMGISLDNDKAKWEKAIADDKLTWTHVSDLQKWKNQAAALYCVNSIPSNLLVDQTGKIIARNIREGKLPETVAGLLK